MSPLIRTFVASILVLAALSLAIVPAGTAAVIRVPADQPTIQAGINAALPGDMVLVAPGTYSGPGNQGLDLLGKDIAVVSESGPQVTILDGQGSGNGFAIHLAETRAALVEGFTMQNGVGGIFIHLASPTIRNCVVTGSLSLGLQVMGQDYPPSTPRPDPIIEGCTFQDNAGDGLVLREAPLGVFRDCTFIGNGERGIRIESGYWGGGSQVFERCTIAANAAGGVNLLFYGQPTFTDCVIRDHSGRGVDENSESGRPTFRRCTFLRNAGGAYSHGRMDGRGAAFEDCTFEANSGQAGAALYFGNVVPPPSGASVLRCRFVGNSATNQGGAIAVGFGQLVVEESVFWNNTVGQSGGAVATSEADVTLRSSTIVGSSAPRGAGLAELEFPNTLILDRTIIAYSVSGEAMACAPFGSPSVTATCCDFYGNAGGDWVGCVAALNGTNGNIAADPRFCNLQSGDLTIAEESPCAPAQSGGCGLIGALPPACQTSAVEPATWGQVKARFSL